jgi:hypothetical protein
MSWPRKIEVARIYRDKNKKTFFMVWPDLMGPSGWDAVANVLYGPGPSLGSCAIPPGYVSDNWLKRTAWNELPEEWQDAFRHWIDGAPEAIRGLWRMGEQPSWSSSYVHGFQDEVVTNDRWPSEEEWRSIKQLRKRLDRKP